MKITDSEIKLALDEIKKKSSDDFYTESLDSVRIAYQWLDAQKSLKGVHLHISPIKHVIEFWGCRYVSQYDLDAAVLLHPRFKGSNDCYNLSKDLILPAMFRLEGIKEAGLHMDYRERNRMENFKYAEIISNSGELSLFKIKSTRLDVCGYKYQISKNEFVEYGRD